MKIQYTGEHFIYIDSFQFRIDGVYGSINPLEGLLDRDYLGDGVWEAYDVNVYWYNYPLIEAIMNSEKAIIRFNGDERFFDWVVSSQEKQSVRNVLDAFVAMGGVLPES